MVKSFISLRNIHFLWPHVLSSHHFSSPHFKAKALKRFGLTFFLSSFSPTNHASVHFSLMSVYHASETPHQGHIQNPVLLNSMTTSLDSLFSHSWPPLSFSKHSILLVSMLLHSAGSYPTFSVTPWSYFLVLSPLLDLQPMKFPDNHSWTVQIFSIYAVFLKQTYLIPGL